MSEKLTVNEILHTLVSATDALVEVLSTKDTSNLLKSSSYADEHLALRFAPPCDVVLRNWADHLDAPEIAAVITIDPNRTNGKTVKIRYIDEWSGNDMQLWVDPSRLEILDPADRFKQFD